MDIVKLPVPVEPHTWQECWPVVMDPETGKVVMGDDVNRAIRRIHRKLGQLDRIKFHQACCESRHSPAHLAVIEKILNRLQAELPELESGS